MESTVSLFPPRRRNSSQRVQKSTTPKKEFAIMNARHSATLQEIRYFEKLFYTQSVNAILLLWVATLDRGGKRKGRSERRRAKV